MNNKSQNKLPITPKSDSKTDVTSKYRWHGWIVLIFGVALYVNTISHQFTQDDAIVIYDNMYTTKGVSGLKGLFTKDTFFGISTGGQISVAWASDKYITVRFFMFDGV